MGGVKKGVFVIMPYCDLRVKFFAVAMGDLVHDGNTIFRFVHC